MSTLWRRPDSRNLNLKGTDQDKAGGLLATDRVTITLDDAKNTATIHLLTDAKPATQIELQAHELDAVLAVLGEARAVMRAKVPTEPPEVRGAREVMIVDPAWRTNSQLHPALAGIILRLRHLGFGWLTFLLPHREAHSLGNWLTRNAQPARDDAPSGEERTNTSEREIPSERNAASNNSDPIL